MASLSKFQYWSYLGTFIFGLYVMACKMLFDWLGLTASAEASLRLRNNFGVWSYQLGLGHCQHKVWRPQPQCWATYSNWFFYFAKSSLHIMSSQYWSKVYNDRWKTHPCSLLSWNFCNKNFQFEHNILDVLEIFICDLWSVGFLVCEFD